MLAVLVLLEVCAVASTVHQYGHAFQAPGDFTAQQYAAIARTFTVFTVEKRHAFGVYGDPQAPRASPAHFNSINATIGTARKIKRLNASVNVLMYWNSVIHYNMYECESQVQPGWLLNPNPYGKEATYNYSVAAFRAWWVDCAASALEGSDGMIDGFFLDAVPKVETLEPRNSIALWGAMVDQLRTRIGEDKIVIYNGFYLSGGGKELAGSPALAHTDHVYIESLASVSPPSPRLDPSDSLLFLEWLRNTTTSDPSKTFVGHGHASEGDERQFVVNFAVYLMIASEHSTGMFLNNWGYQVDQGLLEPHPLYNAPLGRPKGPFESAGWKLTRPFTNGTVTVDMQARTASIQCGRDVYSA